MNKSIRIVTALLGVCVGAAGIGQAQTPAPNGPPPTARSQAPIDVTGNWVSLVTRDWRYRMVVPRKGEYQGLPLSLAGKQYADAWNAAQDEAAGRQCAPYGGGVVMMLPTRLRISWQDDQTLQVQTDAGMQTRTLRFQSTPAPADTPRSWQGYSAAAWVPFREARGGFGGGPPAAAAPKFGSLKITTTHLLAGLIRKNGVAYSDQSSVTEYWEVQTDPVTNTRYLIVLTALNDPLYLTRPYYTTATFKQEPDGSKWDPTPCTLTSTP